MYSETEPSLRNIRTPALFGRHIIFPAVSRTQRGSSSSDPKLNAEPLSALADRGSSTPKRARTPGVLPSISSFTQRGGSSSNPNVDGADAELMQTSTAWSATEWARAVPTCMHAAVPENAQHQRADAGNTRAHAETRNATEDPAFDESLPSWIPDKPRRE